VSNRDFDVKILSLQTDKENFKPYTGDINVSIIATPDYVDGDDEGNQLLCNQATPLNIPQTIHFTREFQKDVTITNITGAIKNASFQVIYNLESPTPQYACSRDVFAIRPEKFVLEPSTSEDIELLSAGVDHNTTLKALQYNSSSATSGYNLAYVGSDDFNVSVNKYNPDGSINNSLHGTFTFAANNFNVVNGVSTDSSGNHEVVALTYDDIGKIAIHIQDTTWAQVDIDNEDTAEDCSGAYICGDINATFIPDHFSLENVAINNSGSNYTYFSNDLNISAAFSLTISAKNAQDATTQNFDSGSWENPLTVTYEVTAETGLTLNKNEISSPLKLGFANGSYTLSNTETNSSKKLMFNYNRAVSTSYNPLLKSGSDMNLTMSSQFDSSSGATKVLTRSSLADNNATFVFARSHAPRQRFTGDTAETSIYFEVYCYTTDTRGKVCKKELLPNGLNSKQTDDPRWFINTQHTSATQGTQGVITQKNGSGDITQDSVGTISNGEVKVTLKYDGTNYPYKATMEMNSSTWLIYNKYDASATTNEFEVEFGATDSAWAGAHETNTTTTNSASSKTNRRLMW
jgi:hypothetical protein